MTTRKPPNYREAKCCKTCKWKKGIPWENDVLCTQHDAHYCSEMICDDYSPEGEGEG